MKYGMKLRYYTKQEIESMEHYKLLNTFDDAITDEVKIHYLTVDGVPDELTEQINMLRNELLKRMIQPPY